MAGKRSNGHGPEEVTAREREALVINLRRSGATYDQIAAEVGYGSAASAYKAFKRAMARTIREPADEYRAMHRDRLETLLRHAMPGVMAGVARSIEVARGVLDSLAKLDGLDAPKRIKFEDDLEGETRAMAIAAGLDPDEAVADVREMLKTQTTT